MLYSVDYANFRCYGSMVVTTPTRRQLTPLPGVPIGAEKPTLGGPLTTAISYDNQATIETAGRGHRIELELPAAQRQRVALELAGDLPRLLRDQDSLPRRVRRPQRIGRARPRPEPLGYQSWRLRLAVCSAPLGYFTERLGRQLALAATCPPSIRPSTRAKQAIKANNAAVAAGGPGITLSYTPPISQVETDSYSIFDLSFNWEPHREVHAPRWYHQLVGCSSPSRSAARPGFPVGDQPDGRVPRCVRAASGAPTGFSNPVTGCVQRWLLRHDRSSLLHGIPSQLLRVPSEQ